jgi:hypothetical protein
MARNYLQGTFTPTKPEKYVGNVNNITFRSSWERKAMLFFDTTPSILKWASEEHIIPYISPVDNRPHRYFVDFVVQCKTKSGDIKTYAVEIKPKVQCEPPKTPKRQTKSFLESVQTYAVNQAKWKAAEAWCSKNKMEFLILTEYELGIVR